MSIYTLYRYAHYVDTYTSNHVPRGRTHVYIKIYTHTVYPYRVLCGEVVENRGGDGTCSDRGND